MAKPKEVWRKVDNQAVRCTDCVKNREFQINGTEDPPVGVGYECLAKNEGCVFLHAVPDNDKWYPGFREVFDDIKAENANAVEVGHF